MSLLKKLFGRGSADSATLTPEQQGLLDRAKRTVQNYLNNGHAFPLFAMVLQRDGEVASFLPSDEFTSERDAFVGILQSLIPQARSGAIIAAVLVTPMAPPPGSSDSSAMFDLEQRGKTRFAAILPYRQGVSGLEYGEVVLRKMEPKLFAS